MGGRLLECGDRGEPMNEVAAGREGFVVGDDENSGSAGQASETIREFADGFEVEMVGGFVEDEEPGLTVERAGQREFLALSAGEGVAPVVNGGVVAAREFPDEGVSFRQHGGLAGGGFVGDGLAVDDVFENGAAENDRRLRYDGDAGAKGRNGELGIGEAIGEQAAGLGQVQAAEEMEQGGFARAVGAHENGDGPGFDGERDTREDRFAGVTEMDIVQSDAAGEGDHLGAAIRFGSNGAVKRFNTGKSANARVERGIGSHQALDASLEEGHGEVDFEKRAKGDGPLGGQAGAEGEDGAGDEKAAGAVAPIGPRNAHAEAEVRLGDGIDEVELPAPLDVLRGLQPDQVQMIGEEEGAAAELLNGFLMVAVLFAHRGPPTPLDEEDDRGKHDENGKKAPVFPGQPGDQEQGDGHAGNPGVQDCAGHGTDCFGIPDQPLVDIAAVEAGGSGAGEEK